MKRKLDYESQLKVLRNRPQESHGYFLSHSTLGRFPPDGTAWLIDPNPTDPEVPDGVFQIKYQTTLSKDGRVIPTAYVPTLEFKGGQTETPSATARPASLPPAPVPDHPDLMGDPQYRQHAVEHAKVSWALDLQMKQASLLHHMKLQNDQADQLRINHFNRLEVQGMFGFLQEMTTESVKAALNNVRAAGELTLAAQEQARALRESGANQAPGIGLAEVAVQGMDTLSRLLGRSGERTRDMPVDAVFGSDGQEIDDAALHKALQQQTKDIREEIERLRKQAAAPKPENPENPFLAELKALRAELAEMKAQSARATDKPTSGPLTPPSAQATNTGPTNPPPPQALATQPPVKPVPAPRAIAKAKPKTAKRSKPAASPAPNKKKKPKRLGGKK